MLKKRGLSDAKIATALCEFDTAVLTEEVVEMLEQQVRACLRACVGHQTGLRCACVCVHVSVMVVCVY
jgi:hypothetical protein